MRKRLRWIFIGLALVLAVVILADTQGAFDDLPYVEVPHGSHSHYLPKDCGADLNAGNFPTRPPGPGERISCDGRIVPAAE